MVHNLLVGSIHAENWLNVYEVQLLRIFSTYLLSTVRLASSASSPSSGRVEVRYKGIWGTICDYSWDLQDANVVCRQLGYDGALSVPRRAIFGRGAGQIWLSHVQCVGNEESISQCRHMGWGVHYCQHSYDASVVCRPAGKVMHVHGSIKISVKLEKPHLFPSLLNCSVHIKEMTLFAINQREKYSVQLIVIGKHNNHLSLFPFFHQDSPPLPLDLSPRTVFFQWLCNTKWSKGSI